MYYVYLLRSKRDNKLYIGYTQKLRVRLEQHNNGEVLSTKSRRPLEVIYVEGYKSILDAKKREKNLKLFSKAYYGLRKRLVNSL